MLELPHYTYTIKLAMRFKSSCWLLCLAIIFFCTNFSYAQKTEVDSSRFDHIILPIPFYLPETSVGISATGVATFRLKNEPLNSRPSQIIYSAVYTWKKQILLLAPFEIYKNNQNTRFQGEIGYFKYFYNYFGIGPNSRKEDLENFDVRFPRIEFTYSKNLFKDIFFGTGLKYDYFNITKIKEDGLLDTNQPIGTRGGDKFNLVLLAYKDTRDNIFAPHKGYYSEITFLQSFDSFLSDYNYQRIELDLRYYLPTTSHSTLASQVVWSYASQETPFFDLPYLSSPTLGRGFDDRRFINHTILSLQSEWRFPIFKKLKGASFLATHFIPEDGAALLKESPIWSYGLGLRFEVDEKEKTRFRLDFAKGDDSFNFYFTLNEAF